MLSRATIFFYMFLWTIRDIFFIQLIDSQVSTILLSDSSAIERNLVIHLKLVHLRKLEWSSAQDVFQKLHNLVCN